jgi:hypothetical protein
LLHLNFVVIHNRPSQRGSWDPHGEPGLYLGPAVNHFRCFRVFSLRTKKIRISDSIAWFPESVRLPGSTKEELLISAINDFVDALDGFKNKVNLDPQTIEQFLYQSETAIDKLRHFTSMYNSSVIRDSIGSDKSPPMVVSKQSKKGSSLIVDPIPKSLITTIFSSDEVLPKLPLSSMSSSP